MSSTHEDFSRDEKPATSSERSFGLIFGAVFLLVGLIPLFSRPERPVRWWAFGLSILFAWLALFWTLPLKPLNRLWTRLGLLLFRFTNPLILGLVFYITVVPIGLLLRLCGKDLLNLRFDRAATTYWIKRDPPGPLPETMKNQF